jgi:hypothetical protein
MDSSRPTRFDRRRTRASRRLSWNARPCRQPGQFPDSIFGARSVSASGESIGDQALPAELPISVRGGRARFRAGPCSRDVIPTIATFGRSGSINMLRTASVSQTGRVHPAAPLLFGVGGRSRRRGDEAKLTVDERKPHVWLG